MTRQTVPGRAARAAACRALAFCALGLQLLAAAATAAEPADTLVIDGAVAHPLTLHLADLAALPTTEVRVTYQTGHGPEDATYAGVSLWSLIDKAGLGDDAKARKARTRRYIVATATDGYQVVLSLAEIDPDFEGKPAIIALTRDGKPIEPGETFRLALPGDKHGARNLHQLNHIELK